MGHIEHNNNSRIGNQITFFTLIFGFCYSAFIFSEYIFQLEFLDQLKIKHLYILTVIVVFQMGLILKRRGIAFPKDTITVIFTSLFLYAISVSLQAYHMRFQIYSVEELYYLIVPILFVTTVYQVEGLSNIDYYVNIIFASCSFAFLVRFYSILTIGNIRMISFFNSHSPFESDLAHFFLFAGIYYLYRRRYHLVGIAFLFNYLTLKRFSLVFFILFILIHLFISIDRKVPKWIQGLSIFFFIFAPIVFKEMISPQFASWFYRVFNVSFNKFTMSRYAIISTVLNADLTMYGLGTVTDFLETRNVYRQVNMHNDLLRIYLECSVVGTIVYTTNLFKISRSNFYSFMIMCYIFSELLFAHFLGPGSILFWIVCYLLIFFFNEESMSDVGKGV